MKKRESQWTICVGCIILILISSSVHSMILPHPYAEMVQNNTWVPVGQYRRKMGIDYGYETKLINPELCRFETEKDCKDIDDTMQSHAHRTLQMVQSTGTLKILVILLQFDNHVNREMINFQDVDYLFNSDRTGTMVTPTGSIKSYFKVNSYGKLTIEADIIPWAVVPQTEQDCLFGNNGMHKDFQKCFWPILDELDILHADPNHPFSWEKYDQNKDTFLDTVVILHSGYAAEFGRTDPNGVGAEGRIWSHSIGPHDDRWKSKYIHIDLGSYSVMSAFHANLGGEIAKVGLVAHEMIHLFGMPDLFDLSRPDQGGGVGSYSIMSNAWGPGYDPSYCGSVDPWTKIKLGWVTPKKISFSGTYKMLPSQTTPDIYIIEEPYPNGEALVIENRQKLGFDGHLFTGGALIWHIDDNVYLNTVAGGPYQGDEWPANGKHYQVALLQADGEYELEQNINDGHGADFFKEGSTLGTRGYPNTDSYQGGNVVPTNIEIVGFEEDGLDIIFEVKGLPAGASATSSPLRTPAPLPAPDPTKCIVNINSNLCPHHIEGVVPQAGCDCYNFCGNGVGQSCCAFGEICQISCHSGGLIAGCIIPEATDTRAAPILKEEYVSNEKEGEFLEFVKDSEGVGVDRVQAAAYSTRSGFFLLPFGFLLCYLLR